MLSRQRITRPHGIAAVLIVATLVGAPVQAASSPPLAGCWTQTSPVPLEQTAPGKEWGSRTWCFKPRGRMTSLHLACQPRGGCDGWDYDTRYRWRRPFLSIRDVDLSDDGKRQTQVWRRCRVRFDGADRMVLVNCYFSSTPWTRDR